MIKWVLILWLGDASPSSNYPGYADSRGAIATQEFTQKDRCEAALAAVQQRAQNQISGVCVQK